MAFGERGQQNDTSFAILPMPGLNVSHLKCGLPWGHRTTVIFRPSTNKNPREQTENRAGALQY